MSDYPEHDKLRKVAEISQAQGELLEWLQGQGVNLMRYETWTDTVEDDCRGCPNWSESRRQREQCDRCGNAGVIPREVDREGWLHDPRSIQSILADYHEIDQRKLEREKRAMLATIRG